MRNAIDWTNRAKEVAALVAVGTFLSIIQPFDSGGGAPFWRIWVFWTGLVIVGSVIGESVVWGFGKLLPKLPKIAVLLLAATGVAVLMVPIVALFTGILGATMPVARWPGLFVGVWVISAFMTGMGFMLDKTLTPVSATETSSSATIRAKFLERLPQRLRMAELRAISSEDHYLRIHTSKGSELILMRLADAVRELDGADGVQTHRSWWVARDAVADARREGGRTILVTAEGVEVPVSRSFSAKVKQAGLG